MAKIKVYELAKELDKSSKEILALLADKGVEAKSHMSTLEDDAAEMVKAAFGKKNAKEAEKKEAPKTEAVKDEAKKQEQAKEEAPKEKEYYFCQQPT